MAPRNRQVHIWNSTRGQSDFTSRPTQRHMGRSTATIAEHHGGTTEPLRSHYGRTAETLAPTHLCQASRLIKAALSRTHSMTPSYLLGSNKFRQVLERGDGAKRGHRFDRRANTQTRLQAGQSAHRAAHAPKLPTAVPRPTCADGIGTESTPSH